MNAAAELRAALLTPPGRGAVAVVALAGAEAERVVAEHFTSTTGAAPKFEPDRIRFGRWNSRDSTGAAAGEELVVCRRGDGSFEIHCHGGEAASAAILATLADHGCAIVTWQQWLAAEAEDPIAAEARTALAAATTTRTASILLDQAAGALRRALDEATELIAAGRHAEARQRIEQLLARAALGRRLTEPFRVVLVGRPNVGKSSLLNALLGYRRAVVFDLPGTTRDVVTAATAVAGWPIELSDTAGLRTSADELESAGMSVARRRADEADLVLFVTDLTEPWTAEDAAISATHPHALIVHNKADAAATSDGARPDGLRISARTGQGIEQLIATIADRLVQHPPQPRDAVPFTARQEADLRRLRDSLSAEEAI